MVSGTLSIMNEWIEDTKKRIVHFLFSYGKVTLCGALLSVSLLFVCLIVSHVSPHKLEVSFLDVGQGDAILVQTPSGKQMLIDGGATNKVMEELAKHVSYFDHTIDVIVATHPDADHVTGLIPVLKKFVVENVVLSPSGGATGIYDDVKKHIDEEHTEVHHGVEGDIIDFGDGVVARILYPSRNYVTKKDDTNDASVSMVITYGNESFLLTGDLPSIREPLLIKAGLPRNITVYKAGHHGSKYSSSEPLLTYIRPEYVVISAGKENKYGHPNPEALERLQKYSKEVISTIDKGAITFITDGKTMEVKVEK